MVEFWKGLWNCSSSFEFVCVLMEMVKCRPEIQVTTYDEASMERSKSFVKALQELKNLKPQLHSAAEYCEKSYLHSEQKEMVLENLKDYAVRALVNTIDHLGTVAYKLGDILEQQTMDISSMDLKIACLNQKLLTCETYTDEEGLRQQKLLAVIPRHHKHYILPNSVNKKVHFGPHIQTDPWKSTQAKSRVYSSASTTLSWHLASETASTLRVPPHGLMNSDQSKVCGIKTPNKFKGLDAEAKNGRKFMPASSVAIQKLGVAQPDSMDGLKLLSPYRSFAHLTKNEIVHPHARSKSMFSALFAKHKTRKFKLNYT